MILTYASIQESQHQRLMQQNLSFLDEATQQRLQRFRRWQDAQATLLGRLLLRASLWKNFRYELQANSISYSSYSKPHLHDSDIQFNISHSDAMVVCVLQEKVAIGVDIEAYRPIAIRDFRSQMTSNEWNRVQQADNTLLAFYDYWTSKEAILKVVGAGLQIDLKSFEIPADRAGVELNGQYWHLRLVELEPNYCCYVSSALPIQSLIVDKVSDLGLI
ncbi:MAG: 4'-phosphopantetheinyl transferase superfamily protein [Bacteroidota bacterium]